MIYGGSHMIVCYLGLWSLHEVKSSLIYSLFDRIYDTHRREVACLTSQLPGD